VIPPPAPRPALRNAALAIALGAAAATAALPTTADAAPLAVALESHDGRLHAGVDLGPVLPADLPSRLGNGLRNVLAVFVGVVPVGAEGATASYARVIEVLYDVWEESWTVTIRDPQSPGGRRRVVGTAAELGRLLAHGADAELGPVDALPVAPFTVDVRIDLNPVSPELLATTREYLAGAAGRPGGASRSVLGAVAGFLLREPEDDGEVLFLRSAPLTRDAVKAR
jgi:hypothetical protein